MVSLCRLTPMEEEEEEVEDQEETPDISQMVNIWDFDPIAKKNVSKEAWAYMMSGADDEVFPTLILDVTWSPKSDVCTSTPDLALCRMWNYATQGQGGVHCTYGSRVSNIFVDKY